MYKKIVFSTLVIVFTLISSVNAQNIVWVAMAWDEDGDGANDSQEWVDMLTDEGFTIDFQPGRYDVLTSDLVGELNSADLVIVSATIQSSIYTTNAAEAELWNSVTAPMLNCCPYVLRSTRWKWVNNGDGSLPNNNGDQGSPLMQVLTPAHPIFYGISLDSENQVQVVDPDLGSGHATFIGTTDAGNGTLLAKTVGEEWLWIAEWKTGVEFYNGAGAYATNHRMTFSIGAHEGGGYPARGYNFTDEGWKLFLNTVRYMLGEFINPLNASSPNPSDEAIDVRRDVILSWTPGEYAFTHHAYFGTDFNDVNDGTALFDVYDQDVNCFAPGILEYGRTYYWRIDEVNAPFSPGIYKGQVWRFTAEPISYALQSQRIIEVLASSAARYAYPENTINNSGLDVDNLHSTSGSHMWLSQGSDPGETWIQYEFDDVYKLHQMLVWNYNRDSPRYFFGFKDVNVEYSEDGQTWEALANVPQFSMAPGTDEYESDTTVDFGGIKAKYVKLTALTNWGTDSYDQYGLSEVRFLYIPLRPREPIPQTGAINIPVDTILSWRPGREATEHKVYLSLDEQEVINGTASSETIYQAYYGPLPLELDCMYYWRVDEVNYNETHATWKGDIWNFATRGYLVVDDFEGYKNNEPHRVFDTWTDGRDDPLNGSIVGYTSNEHYLETGFVHNGMYSAPIFYDNSASTYSEVTVKTNDLMIGTDWTKSSAETLVLWFHGNPGNSAIDRMYVKINGVKIDYDGNPDNISRPIWKNWNIDLASVGIYDLSNFTDFAIGIEATGGVGGSGVIFIDDICLYRLAPPTFSGDWVEAELPYTLSPPMVAYEDPDASGGFYISVEPGNNSTDWPPAPYGVASYSIIVSQGTYKISGRVKTPTLDEDSFWLNISGGITTNTTNHVSGWIQWDQIPLGSDWHWDDVHSTDDGNQTVEFFMEAGTYTMRIAYREEGAMLDAILISKID